MSKRFWNFGSAWFSKKQGQDLINVVISDPTQPKSNCEVQIFARHLASGEELPLSSFFLKKNAKKFESDDPSRTEKWPDYTLAFVTEE
jgi:hypothetical protein